MSGLSPAFAVVVLGAGASSRMGRPKLLLPWGDTTLVGSLVTRWQALGARQIALVHGPGAAPLIAELDRIGLPPRNRILNPDPGRGMFSSVRCAAAWDGWQPGLSHLVLTLGDQPLVRGDTLRAVLAMAEASPERICQPARAGRPRHPVILPWVLLPWLAGSTDGNLKEFLQRHEARRVVTELDDPGLDLDLDEPGDYERALRLRLPPGG